MGIVMHARQREMQLCRFGLELSCLQRQPLRERVAPSAVDVIPHEQEQPDAAEHRPHEQGGVCMTLPSEGIHQICNVPMTAQAHAKGSDVILQHKTFLSEHHQHCGKHRGKLCCLKVADVKRHGRLRCCIPCHTGGAPAPAERHMLSYAGEARRSASAQAKHRCTAAR